MMTSSYMYIYISLTAIIASFLLFRSVAGSMSLTKLNMISYIFYYGFLLQSFIGSLLIVLEIDGHYIVNRIQNFDSRLHGWMAIQYMFIATPLGMVLADKLFFKRKVSYYFTRCLNSPLQALFTGDKSDGAIRVTLYFFSLLSLMSIAYTFFSMRTIPFVALLSGEDALGLTMLREEAKRGFTGIVYIKNVFAIMLTPLLTYISYLYYSMNRSRIDKWWFGSMFVASCLILSYSLEKSPLATFFLGFIFLFVLKNGKITLLRFVSIGLLGLSLVVLLYIFVATKPLSELFQTYNTGIVGRIILGQICGTFLSFDIFPYHKDFIGFSSFSNVASSLLNLEYSPRSASLIMEHLYARDVLAGQKGVMSSLFIGEAWANWGIWGVLLSPIYVGFLMQLLFKFLLSIKKTPISMGVLTYLSLKHSITGGVNDFFWNISWLIIALFILAVIAISAMLDRVRYGY